MICFFLLCAATVSATLTNYWLVTGAVDKQLKVVTSNTTPPYTVLAMLMYDPSYETKGWDYVNIRGFEIMDSYYYAGYLEGYVTAHRIQPFYKSRNQLKNLSPEVEKWVDSQREYIAKQARINVDDSYWSLVAAQLQLMAGLAAGYTASGYGQLTSRDVYFYNFRYEIGDIERLFSKDKSMKISRKGQHCSALIKLTPNDLFSSHVTWSGYESMMRQIKVYNFQERVTFSSVPLQIHSGDDWYITSRMLSVQETTNDYFNSALLAALSPNTVPEFIRVMVANSLATSGAQWTGLFSKYHSGTYCNQYMVIDYKRYDPGASNAAQPNNLLWIVEEIPGDIQSADVTQVLRDQGYWPSYNIPYFKRIYDASGFRDQMEKYGDLFSYTQYSRPRIFARDHHKIHDLDSMMYMMQYNHYETDPLSTITNCSYCMPLHSPMLTISSRADLVDPNAVLPDHVSRYYRKGLFGAIDAKITSYNMIQLEHLVAFNGPTPQQKLFRWSDNNAKAPDGMPDLMNFQWNNFTGFDPHHDNHEVHHK